MTSANDGALARPDVSERLKHLSPAQRALLFKRLAEQRGAVEDQRGSERIPRRGTDGPAPLSASQELLWLLDQIGGSGQAYNAPEAMRLRGPLDVDALAAAFTAVVTANHVLRTVFRVVDGEPMQVVLAAAPVELLIEDLGHVPEHRREDVARDLAQRAAEEPLDLAESPMRVHLLRLGPDEHVLLTLIHHIAVDGSSRRPFWDQLGAAYAMALAGEPVVLPEPELQYADFATWQRAQLDDGVLRQELDHWVARLADAPQLLELPTDRPRPPVQSYDGAHLGHWIGADHHAALRKLAQDEGATLFPAVIALLAAFLSKYSGQDDIVIGTPVAARNRVELERMIGYFANTLALRIDVTGDPTFREILRRSRQAVIEGLANQEAPFAKVVQEVSPVRDLSRPPLFQVLAVLHSEARAEPSLTGLSIERFLHERAWSKFDITFGMAEHPDGLHVGWEFSTDLFDEKTIERMQRHLEHLVDVLLDDPDRPLSELHLLDDAERALLVEEWNGPRTAAAPVSGLHELFERSAAANPDAPALFHDGTVVSYGELDALADTVAQRLMEAGVGRGDAVGILAERSPLLIAALLGVLKAGGVCLPLDPEYPAERIAAMLEAASTPVVLSTTGVQAFVPAAFEVVLLDKIEGEGSEAVRSNVAVTPGDPAYLVFTSGSTGRPKGVELTHGGLVNHALAAIDLYGLTAADRVLQFCSVSFDISIEEIFPTLAAGGAIVLRDDTLPIGGDAMSTWLADRGVTVMDLPTAFWHEWVRDVADNDRPLPSSLRLVIVGGEKASTAVFASWRAVAGDVRWLNTYGPSETSVIATTFEPPADWDVADGRDIPIGRPIANCRVYVLDAAMQPAPIGVPGELYIGGAGVARGYLGQPDATAEKFVDVPFASEPGARMYRTGDRARWLPDGTIEFAGRVDHQVKIRGFRVEPGEVETVIGGHPHVAECIVNVRDEGARGRSLVAYVVPRVGSEVGDALVDAVLAHVRDRLPAYLVPSAVVVLDELPLTVNGKVDTARLPAPADRGGSLGGSAAPQDEVERKLQRIWCEALGLTDIGVNESFFDVGGHSLLAVRVFAAIERELGVNLPLSALMRAQRITDLAALIRDGRSVERVWQALVPMRPLEGRSAPPLFCIHGPSGQVLIYRDLAEAIGDEQPVYALQDPGIDRSIKHAETIEEMAATYIEEIRSVWPDGPYLLLGFCMGGVTAYEIGRQLVAEGADVPFIGLIDSSPFGHLGGRRSPAARALRVIRELGRAKGRDRAEFLQEKARNGYYRLDARIRRRLANGEQELPEFLRLMEHVNMAIARRYVTPVFEHPVTFFRIRPRVEDASQREKRLVWQRQTGGRSTTVNIDAPTARHTTLMRAPNVSGLVDAVQRAIATALGDGPPSA